MVDVRPPRTILQFAATLESRKPEDKDREFVISYTVDDHSFEVFERHIPNSGFRGGKFMQRTVVKKPNGDTYEPREIYVGAKLNLGGWVFVLQEASEEALKTMEANSDVFVKCDLSELLKVVRARLDGRAPQLLVAFQRRDVKKKDQLKLSEIQEVLKEFGITFGDQEFLTLLRRYQVADWDLFDYKSFVQSLV